MKKIAHRGIYDNKFVIENTYKSIKDALDNEEFIGVEFDIRITKDKEFVVFHDAIYDGKLIKNMYYKELPKFIPKLKTILKIKSDKIFLVEIKYIDNHLIELVKLLNKYSKQNIYVMSFNTKLIEKIGENNRNFKIGILNYILNSIDINYLDFICVIDSLINDELVEYLKKEDKELFSYGIINKNNIGVFDINYIVDATI